MKYFLDTEFMESPGSIELLSIGIVVSDNSCDPPYRSLYIVNDDADLSKANPWVKENVLPHLDGETYGLPYSHFKDAILEFVGDDVSPEFWGYYCDYDWVVFCWIFGRMIDLPKNFPMYCRDLKQWADQLGVPKPAFPKQSGTVHNAVDDALWNMKLYECLRTGSWVANRVVAMHPERDPKEVRYKLPPELVDGFHWTTADTGMEVGIALDEWRKDPIRVIGDSVEIEVVRMTDEEVEALPEV